MRDQTHLLILSSTLFAVACGGAGEPNVVSPPVASQPVAVSLEREIDRVLETVLAPPSIQTEAGFSASVLVAPGEMYDPLTMIPVGGVVWVNDDGGTGPKGRFWAIDGEGNLSVLVPPERVNATTGFDIAPPGFGAYEGQIFALAQQEFYPAGAMLNHVLEVIDLQGDGPPERFCELPTHGSAGNRTAGIGLEVRFGPPDSPFDGRLFSLAILNRTVYQATPDGSCTPFVTFDRSPWGFAFSADGSRMLVALRAGSDAFGDPADDAGEGAIVTVGPDGTIDPSPIATGLRMSTDIEIAPPDFGPYAGEVFFLDWETSQSVPLDEALEGTATLNRVSSDGVIHRVASGFIRPAGLAFVNGSIWVSNINRDRVEMPEGSIVRIDID